MLKYRGFRNFLENTVREREKHQESLSEIQTNTLIALAAKPLARKGIFVALGMSGDSRSFKRHLEPLLSQGLIEMTLPDKAKEQTAKVSVNRKRTSDAG